MPIPPNLAKQELQFAYFRAVVADAGATVAKPEPDIGIDFIVAGAQMLKDGTYSPTGLTFHCQLKASTDWRIEGDFIVYPVKADSYNKLAGLQKGLGVLIVFRLPKDGTDILTVEEHRLQLENCCYWYLVPRKPTQNTSSETIQIHRSQLFDRDAVAHLLELDRIDAYSGQGRE